MYERVRAYVKKYHMLQEKDHVIAGVSGGADSVCLLFMLVKLQKEMRFGLTVVHIHHGLRGEHIIAQDLVGVVKGEQRNLVTDTPCPLEDVADIGILHLGPGASHRRGEGKFHRIRLYPEPGIRVLRRGYALLA